MRLRFGLTAVAMSVATGVGATELTIGSRAETSLDPHFQYLSSNVGYSKHIYGALTARDNNARTVADLAYEWSAVEPTVWEFKLREGVVFHDGTPLTADDVIFSLERVPNIPNNPNPYTGQLKTITDVEKVDALTVRITTDVINPQLPSQLTQVFMVSKAAAEGKSTADFTTGSASIGTGPYKVVEYKPSQSLTLERDESYFGEKPEWRKVTFKFISNDAARVAALLSGDVDVIDFVSPTDVPRLRATEGVAIHTRPSDRVMYLSMDQHRDQANFATDKSGNPLPQNPFKDARVRKAISLGINRDAIVERVMEGFAVPANQMVPPGMLGYNESLPALEYDVERAKVLLAEAGYPDGFGLTVHCPNDRYVNDGKICLVVGQMLSRIGLDMKVVSQPRAVYFSNYGEYSLALIGWGSAGEATASWMTLHTPDPEKGLGTFNHGRISIPELDALVAKVITETDDEARGKLHEQVMKLTYETMAVIPLHYQTAIVATRSDLEYDIHVNEYTMAPNVRTKQ